MATLATLATLGTMGTVGTMRTMGTMGTMEPLATRVPKVPALSPLSPRSPPPPAVPTVPALSPVSAWSPPSPAVPKVSALSPLSPRPPPNAPRPARGEPRAGRGRETTGGLLHQDEHRVALTEATSAASRNERMDFTYPQPIIPIIIRTNAKRLERVTGIVRIAEEIYCFLYQFGFVFIVGYRETLNFSLSIVICIVSIKHNIVVSVVDRNLDFRKVNRLIKFKLDVVASATSLCTIPI